MRRIPNFIAGVATAGGGAISDVFDPNTGEVQAKVPHADQALLERASHDAAAAQPAWAAVNPQRRARVMFRFKELIEQHMAELAQLLSSEHNETLSDAPGRHLVDASATSQGPVVRARRSGRLRRWA